MALDISPEFTMAIEYNSDNFELYIGEASPGTSQTLAGWRIKKLTYNSSGRVTNVEWASGNNMFDKIWNSRDTYVYS